MMYVTTRRTKELPALGIGDLSVEDSGWQCFDGWQGLVPGKSSIENCKSLLGEITGISELANGITYDFQEGKIRVTVRDGESVICKIWIDRAAPFPFQPPCTIDEAMFAFGKLVTTGVNRQEGCILERPGMRLCCNAMDETNPINWMEIYCPVSKEGD